MHRDMHILDRIVIIVIILVIIVIIIIIIIIITVAWVKQAWQLWPGIIQSYFSLENIIHFIIHFPQYLPIVSQPYWHDNVLSWADWQLGRTALLIKFSKKAGINHSQSNQPFKNMTRKSYKNQLRLLFSFRILSWECIATFRVLCRFTTDQSVFHPIHR